MLAVLMPQTTVLSGSSFRIKAKQGAMIAVKQDPIQAFTLVFGGPFERREISLDVERKRVALKLGYPRLAATTAGIITQGRGEQELEYEDLLDIFASHGLSGTWRKHGSSRDFVEINRRASGGCRAIEKPEEESAHRIKMRYEAINKWLKADKGEKSEVLKRIPMKRALFFHWWDCFRRLGLLGLSDSGEELFRHAKIGSGMEARIIIDRLQFPQRKEAFYVERLVTQGINIKRNAVFAKWKIGRWNSAFESNLSRLEGDDCKDDQSDTRRQETTSGQRQVERKFVEMLEGLACHSLP